MFKPYSIWFFRPLLRVPKTFHGRANAFNDSQKCLRRDFPTQDRTETGIADNSFNFFVTVHSDIPVRKHRRNRFATQGTPFIRNGPGLDPCTLKRPLRQKTGPQLEGRFVMLG